MSRPSLHLASASPRRRAILTNLGLEFSFAGEDLEERREPGESARDMVRRLAGDKARAALETHRDSAILGADTAVVLDDRVLGKPASRAEALQMLADLSGQQHDVLTAVTLLHAGKTHEALACSQVSFREIPAWEAEAYWQTGEPRDKAGGYAIQGVAAIFVTGIRGSHSGVIGLPIYETARLLSGIGIHVLARPA